MTIACDPGPTGSRSGSKLSTISLLERPARVYMPSLGALMLQPQPMSLTFSVRVGTGFNRRIAILRGAFPSIEPRSSGRPSTNTGLSRVGQTTPSTISTSPVAKATMRKKTIAFDVRLIFSIISLNSKNCFSPTTGNNCHRNIENLLLGIQ